MKKKKICMGMLLLLLLYGCAPVPEEVVTRIQQKENRQTEERTQTGMEYDSIEHIADEIENVKAKTYDNVSFAEDVDIQLPETIVQSVLKQKDDFLTNEEQVVKDFVGSTYQKKYVYTDERTDPPGPEYHDKKNQIYFGMGDNGFYTTMRKEVYQGGYEEIRKEGILSTEMLNEKCHLTDRDITVREAVQIAQAYVDKLCEKYHDLKWVPISVRITYNTEGYDLVTVDFVKTIGNISFPYVYPVYDKPSFPYLFSMTTFIEIGSTDGIPSIDNMIGIQEVKEINEVKKILTFQSVMDHVSELLASYSKKKVKKVSMEHIILKRDEPFDKEHSFLNWKAGTMYETRPCWMVYFHTELEKEEYVIVDALSGDMQYINNNR